MSIYVTNNNGLFSSDSALFNGGINGEIKGQNGQSARFGAILQKLQGKQLLPFTENRQPQFEDTAGVNFIKTFLSPQLSEKVGEDLLNNNNNQSTNWGNFKVLTGAELIGLNNPASFLLYKLESLDSQLTGFTFNEGQIDDIADILLQSGLDEEKIDGLLYGLGKGDLNFERLTMMVSQALSQIEDVESEYGLIVSEESLPALGQFFISLGLSPEVAKNITSQLEKGDKLNSSILKDLIHSVNENDFLQTGSVDIIETRDMLLNLGATQKDLEALAFLFKENDGQLSLGTFLKFLDTAGQKEFVLNEDHLKQVEDFFLETQANQKAVKILQFDKTLILLRAMGDQNIDDDFENLSPALQALRGGLTSEKNSNSSFSGGDKKEDRREEQAKQQKLAGVDLSAKGKSINDNLIFNESFQGTAASETMAKQIAAKMIYSLRQGVHRLRLNLKPENLGDLDIDLKVRGETLSASILVETVEAKEILEKELETLKETLAQAGLIVENLKINLTYDASLGNSKQGFVGNREEDSKEQKQNSDENEKTLKQRYQKNNTINYLV